MQRFTFMHILLYGKFRPHYDHIHVILEKKNFYKKRQLELFIQIQSLQLSMEREKGLVKSNHKILQLVKFIHSFRTYQEQRLY